MSFRLSSLLVYVTLSAVLISAALWAAEGGQVGNFAGVLLFLAPSLLTLGILNRAGRPRRTTIPMLIAMLPVLAGAQAVYAWCMGEPGLIAVVLLFIWGLQIPIVALVLRQRSAAQPDPVPRLELLKPARIAVDIARLGPAFDLPFDSISPLWRNRQPPISPWLPKRRRSSLLEFIANH